MLSNVNASNRPDIATIQIGPLTLQRLERENAIALIGTAVGQRRKLDVAICNAHTVLLALDDPDYANVLNRMTLLNDGVGVNLASRLVCGHGFPANLNGTDLVPDILATLDIPLRVFLLGASPTSLEGAAKILRRPIPTTRSRGLPGRLLLDG
ncbi:WecB/TagA/CpsF family glycosyltransferase [Breoghania sp.]|uniref:WecB/TagA/CpsF family glycosyltransferase n=1 Tax=Breoghania sp. TaxID=2065378 RepID=UPI0026232916|nr:WecB/TagA/CpsF family glycosyltransferase [Breoghania sp.]MDJ0930997.1 WecB/TagA/CpsF family glycosyltransferase [Breoghania sp.]